MSLQKGSTNHPKRFSYMEGNVLILKPEQAKSWICNDDDGEDNECQVTEKKGSFNNILNPLNYVM
jgi:hypothetical protein